MGSTNEMPVISNRRFAQVKSSFREEHPERYDILAEAVQNAAQSDEFNDWENLKTCFLRGWMKRKLTNFSMKRINLSLNIVTYLSR